MHLLWAFPPRSMVWQIKIKVHHQLEAIQQMTVFAGGMLMLGLNILMFGTLFLLIRVIQRMNKFEKVNHCYHKVLSRSIFFQNFPFVQGSVIQLWFQFMASQQQHPAYMVPNGNNYYSPYPSAITPTGMETSRRRSVCIIRPILWQNSLQWII